MKPWPVCPVQRIWLLQAPPWERQQRILLEWARRSKISEDFCLSCCYRSKVSDTSGKVPSVRGGWDTGGGGLRGLWPPLWEVLCLMPWQFTFSKIIFWCRRTPVLVAWTHADWHPTPPPPALPFIKFWMYPLLQLIYSCVLSDVALEGKQGGVDLMFWFKASLTTYIFMIVIWKQQAFYQKKVNSTPVTT